MALSRNVYHGRVRKASTRTAQAKKAKDVRIGRKARVRGVNVRKGF